jgi:DNA-binding NarL/FixJ family response regulator
MTRALKSRLIVVDDDDILRARIAATIKCSETLDVVGEAATLAEGLQLVARAPDLALVDLGLPDGHGGVLIAYLRRTAPTCRVLVLSVFEDRASVIGAIRAGADGYILKDTPDAEILTSLTHTLEGEAASRGCG